jgi:hypothetical protein
MRKLVLLVGGANLFCRLVVEQSAKSMQFPQHAPPFRTFETGAQKSFFFLAELMESVDTERAKRSISTC